MDFEIEVDSMESANTYTEAISSGLPPVEVDGQTYVATTESVEVQEGTELNLTESTSSSSTTTTLADGLCKFSYYRVDMGISVVDC